MNSWLLGQQTSDIMSKNNLTQKFKLLDEISRYSLYNSLILASGEMDEYKLNILIDSPYLQCSLFFRVLTYSKPFIQCFRLVLLLSELNNSWWLFYFVAYCRIIMTKKKNLTIFDDNFVLLCVIKQLCLEKSPTILGYLLVVCWEYLLAKPSCINFFYIWKYIFYWLILVLFIFNSLLFIIMLF